MNKIDLQKVGRNVQAAAYNAARTVLIPFVRKFILYVEGLEGKICSQ